MLFRSFIAGGGLYSVAPMFFIMGSYIAIPILPPKKRNWLFFVESSFYSALIVVNLYFPEMTYARSYRAHTIMLLFAYVFVAVYTFAATLIIMKQYQKEQDRVEKLNRLLIEQANRDPLTKLYNRRYLTEMLAEKEKGQQHTLSIAIIDIDDFKHINDTYGHLVGDQVLVCLAELAIKTIPESPCICRFGGEEFLFYFDTLDAELILEKLEILKQAFADATEEKFGIRITFSGGMASYKEKDFMNDLIKEAND